MYLSKYLQKSIAIIAALVFNMSYAASAPSVFDLAESEVEASPLVAEALKLEKGETVVDLDVSKVRPEAAMIVKAPLGVQKILFWQIGKSGTEASSRSIEVPAGITLSAITWHPLGRSLFLLAKRSGRQEILHVPVSSWTPISIYRSRSQLRRLVVGPRPYTSGYRVFFGVKKQDGRYTTHTITEKGEREYAVLDSVADTTHLMGAGDYPNVLIADSALPNEFHPAGHFMLWEDGSHCFHKALYEGSNWGSIAKVNDEKPICGGSLSYTPNGASLLHWQREKEGVILISDHGKNIQTLADGIKFISTPSSVADGKGLVGVVNDGDSYSLVYTPIEVPLADVVNAWMYLESPRDKELLSQNSGLFRRRDGDAQLYGLYDSESYYCGAYDVSTPSRPYFVTSDIFLELYAAAFEGLFILSEKRSAIPGFWEFVRGANESLKRDPGTKVAKAFAAVMAVHDGVKGNAEAERISGSEGRHVSSVTDEPFDFGDLKPRSHYVADKTMQDYFRASRYLMDIRLNEEDRAVLKKLPPPVIRKARDWVDAYGAFIAPSKRPLLWSASKKIPGYVSHPETAEQIFPLSWGIDNEVLFSTVYHEGLPEAEQIKGPDGPRLLSSGLDVAAVSGSDLAEALLDASGEFDRYPALRRQIGNLKKRYPEAGMTDNESLYQKWLATLATQWSDDVSSPGETIKKGIWSTKRLQTGLASWATLRHATTLVNERASPECGESGFEAVILRPPRGYVESDPKTFDAIASLFDATIEMVKTKGGAWSDGARQGDGKKDKGLQEGIIRRLTESRDKVRVFRDIASKEVAGKPLTNREYEEILYVGRAAEHNFLIFKSLGRVDLALSHPEPVAKVADVATSGQGTSRLVGVGAPLEWDQIVPFFGRKQIVKGAIYSYYETTSDVVMTDEEWRSKLPGLARPRWVTPYLSQDRLSCPAKAP